MKITMVQLLVVDVAYAVFLLCVLESSGLGELVPVFNFTVIGLNWQFIQRLDLSTEQNAWPLAKHLGSPRAHQKVA